MKTKWLFLILGLQVAWVVGTVAVQEKRLAEGVTVLLETRPVDPRDLLRGDYVILNYDISRLPADRFTPALTDVSGLKNGQTIYVELLPDQDFHRLARASLTPIEPEAGRVVLRGAVGSVWRGPGNGDHVNVTYDLERYYVREGTGNPTGKLTVEVKVPPSGRAVIRQVYVDGVPYAEAMRRRDPS